MNKFAALRRSFGLYLFLILFTGSLTLTGCTTDTLTGPELDRYTTTTVGTGGTGGGNGGGSGTGGDHNEGDKTETTETGGTGGGNGGGSGTGGDHNEG